jgi:hypothetical protein
MTFDHYEVLGVSPTADAATIARAYYRLAAKYHPDHGGCHERMVAIIRAWKVLSDPQQRAAYDQTRRANEFAAGSAQADSGSAGAGGTGESHASHPQASRRTKSSADAARQREVECSDGSDGPGFGNQGNNASGHGWVVVLAVCMLIPILAPFAVWFFQATPGEINNWRPSAPVAVPQAVVAEQPDSQTAARPISPPHVNVSEIDERYRPVGSLQSAKLNVSQTESEALIGTWEGEVVSPGDSRYEFAAGGVLVHRSRAKETTRQWLLEGNHLYVFHQGNLAWQCRISLEKGRLEWRKDNGAMVQLDRDDKETNPWITDELPEGIVGRWIPVTVEQVRYTFTPQSTLVIQVGSSVNNYSWAVEGRALSVYSDGGRAALWTAPVTFPRKGEIAIARSGSKPLKLKKLLPVIGSP